MIYNNFCFGCDHNSHRGCEIGIQNGIHCVKGNKKEYCDILKEQSEIISGKRIEVVQSAEDLKKYLNNSYGMENVLPLTEASKERVRIGEINSCIDSTGITVKNSSFKTFNCNDFDGCIIKNDPIKPNHYCKTDNDVIKFCMDNGLDYMQGNIVKYVVRYKDKNGLEDLKKTAEYLRRLIEREESLLDKKPGMIDSIVNAIKDENGMDFKSYQNGDSRITGLTTEEMLAKNNITINCSLDIDEIQKNLKKEMDKIVKSSVYGI